MNAPGNAVGSVTAALILMIAFVESSGPIRTGATGRMARLKPIPAATSRPLGIPHDWSHSHLIFSRPSSREAERRLERDPRRRIQQAWRHRQAIASSAETYMQSLDALAVRLAAGPRPPLRSAGNKAKRKMPVGAWGESLDVTVSNANGNANYPAKFAFTGSASCTDWVVYTVPDSSSSQFNIFAFKNLYSSICSPTPKLKFTYNASNSSGPLITAPEISLAGDQVTFVEKGATAVFHVLRFADVSSPLPTFPSPSSLSTCVNSSTPPPCVYALVYDTGATASFSAPFYDYTTGQDTAYVSADDGKVFAISPVFGGNAPTVKAGWGNLAVSSGSTLLSPPVYDGVSKNVFVGDQQGFLYYIRTQTTSAGTCNGSTGGTPCVGDSSFTNTLCTGSGAPYGCCTGAGAGHCRFLPVSGATTQITEPVIVDSNTGKVFVFSKGSPTGAGSSVVQTDVQFGIRNVASIGSGTTNVIHAGAFDDNYYNNPTSGNLYVCGQSGGAPQLYAFGFTNSPTTGTMNTSPVSGAPKPLVTGSTSTTCSPLTEDKSGTTDRLFLAVASACPATGATTAGCVVSFDITNGFPSLPSSPPYSISFSQSAALGTSTGTTGIIIDNLSGTTDETNIYFETQNAGSSCSTYNGGTASGSCAVSLTQSSLN